MKSQRSIIYPKDVQRITGKSERDSRKLLLKIRQINNRKARLFVPVTEFCNVADLLPENVTPFLTD